MNFVEPYSAQWYYQRWPKFYNEECYRIMEEYSKNPEKFSMSEGVEENKDNDPVCIYVENKNLKRKVCDSEEEPVVH